MSKKGKVQTVGEEAANTISHIAGTVLSAVGMVILIVIACKKNMGTIPVLSAVFYGVSLILLYLCSSLYHSIKKPSIKKTFRIFDHCSIFLLILGTYVPISLVILKGTIGWILFSVNALCALFGIILNIVNLERWDKVCQFLYIIMGWSIVMSFYPLFKAVTIAEFSLLLLGGVAYTLGTFFYRNNKINYMHFIWHIFVLAGSILHYVFILWFYMK